MRNFLKRENNIPEFEKKIFQMVTQFNRKRILVDVDIESIAPRKIIVPGMPKRPKTATGTIVTVGSEVTAAKKGDKVTLHNEGIIWGAPPDKVGFRKIYRIVNETAIIKKN
jgi:NADPH:quinone reductase-like Zn-dependent oxidoreductase